MIRRLLVVPAFLALGLGPALPSPAAGTVLASFAVTTADSMDLSYPKPDMPCACGSGPRVLDVVRGERENTQVVASASAAATGLRARVNAVAGPDGQAADPAAVSASVAPLGFLNVTPTAQYRGVHTYRGWIPDPIREDLAQVDVPAGSRQPFWVEVVSGRDAAPGRYQVTVELTDASGARAEQRIEVRVWPVAISERNELATTLTTHPDQAARFTYAMTGPAQQRAYVRKTYDFFAKYRVEPDDIYASKVSYNTKTRTGPDPRRPRRGTGGEGVRVRVRRAEHRPGAQVRQADVRPGQAGVPVAPDHDHLVRRLDGSGHRSRLGGLVGAGAVPVLPGREAVRAGPGRQGVLVSGDRRRSSTAELVQRVSADRRPDADGGGDPRGGDRRRPVLQPGSLVGRGGASADARRDLQQLDRGDLQRHGWRRFAVLPGPDRSAGVTAASQSP